MKRILLSSLVLLLALVSCKKDNETSDPGAVKKYAVALNITGFSQVTRNFDGKTAQDTLRDYVQHLSYFVFNSTQGLIKRIDQQASDSSFGLILDSLSSGTYTIALIGSYNEIYIGPSVLGSDYVAYFDLPGTDVFYRKTIITVNGNVNQQLSMDRVVAKVKVTITDAIPAAANKLFIHPRVSPDPPAETGGGLPAGLILSTGEITAGTRGSSSYHPYAIALDSLIGITNYTTEFYILTDGPKQITVGLMTTNTTGGTLTEKNVLNVNIDANKRTVLTGKLFDALNPANGVEVGINNPQWNADSTLVNF